MLSIITLVLCGCEDYNADKTVYDNSAGGYFTVINDWDAIDGSYKIVYANDTGVKYFMCFSGYRYGITPLYNADGSLQIYDGK